MKRLFEKWFCKHKWKVHFVIDIFEHTEDKIPIKKRETLICENCGKIKQINL